VSPGGKGLINWIRMAYDKLVLVIVLFVLLVSGILLGVFVDHEKKVLAAALWKRPDVSPKCSQPVDTIALQEAIESLAGPFQLEYGSNRMLVAETRVACVKCGRPIPYDADVCTFKSCGAPQPTAKIASGKKDTDRDRMPDEWEKQHGLNSMTDDAQKDADGDQFTNLEEYRHQTSPKDPADYPAPVSKLRWSRIGRMPLPFSFQSIQHPARDQVLYVLKDKKTRQDYYVKIGDTVKGFEIIGCEKKTKEVHKKGVSTPFIEDVSILKLRKGDKVIALTLGQDASQGDMAAELIFLIDNLKYIVKINDVITLKNIPYKVVDIQKDAVVVSNDSTGKKTALEKVSVADQ